MRVHVVVVDSIDCMVVSNYSPNCPCTGAQAWTQSRDGKVPDGEMPKMPGFPDMPDMPDMPDLPLDMPGMPPLPL